MAASKNIPSVKVEPRQQLGSRYATRLRKAGRLPAVIYGHKQDPVHVTVDYKEIHHHLHNNAHLLNVQLEGGSESVLIRDVQWDHLGSTLIHVDLARVDLNERVTVQVPLKVVGDAPGLKTPGTILEHPVTEIEIEAAASDIPDEITVDVSALEAGQSISVSDIKLPANVSTTLDPDTLIAAITEVQEVKETDLSAEPTEPKVIGKEEEKTETAE